mgnify:CR=1 FL=1
MLAESFKELGLTLAYGGTNTHMVLLDLSQLAGLNSALTGDIASNILDLCGITCNKNALPGDETGARPRGIRFGTTILTQHGMRPAEMKKIARLVHQVLTSIKTFKVFSPAGEICRGKISLEIMEEVKTEVQKLLGNSRLNKKRQAPDLKSKIYNLEIIGERAPAFLQSITAHDIFSLGPGQAVDTFLLDSSGKTIDEVIIRRLPDKPTGDAHYIMMTHSEKAEMLLTWLNGLSDGYILFDETDVYAKVEGPVVVRRMAKGEGGMGKAKIKSKKSAFRIPHSEFDFRKPYFIGQNALLRKDRLPVTDDRLLFKHQPYQGEPRKTYLYEEHLKLTKKQFMIPFAGWSMPVWYTRASEEHLAVRQAAGLFDVSHMGRFQIKGKYATRFLDLVTTNYVPKLRPGQAHYSYILDPAGQIMDDIFLYKLAEDDYILVCNAANAEKISQWLRSVNQKSISIDNENPARCIEGQVEITDIRDTAAGDAQLVNIALQGPNSLKILLKLSDSSLSRCNIGAGASQISKLRRLEKSHFAEFKFNGIWVLATRTGYTGEEIGFEIFVKPTEAATFWNSLLDGGKEFGLKPCGLAARDSLRTEAGLPLYGHELNGVYNITSTEAGYGAFIKRHKPFFIGRKSYLLRESTLEKKQIVRFEIKTSGTRMVKPEDMVVEQQSNEQIGVVTSCTLVPQIGTRGSSEIGTSQNIQVGMAYLNQASIKKGVKVSIFRSATGPNNEKVLLSDNALMVSRFPMRKELADRITAAT